MEDDLIDLYEAGHPDRVATILETVLRHKFQHLNDIEVFVNGSQFGVRFNGDLDYLIELRDSLSLLLYDLYPPSAFETKKGKYTFISKPIRGFDFHPKLYINSFE